MLWRDYFVDNLPSYAQIFLALVASLFFLNLWVGAEKFPSVFFILTLLMFFIADGKLHELLPKAGGRIATHCAFYLTTVISAYAAYIIFSSSDLNWQGRVLDLFGLLGPAVFLTLLSSLMVYDEVSKIPYDSQDFKKTP
jgi:hypothetical protein